MTSCNEARIRTHGLDRAHTRARVVEQHFVQVKQPRSRSRSRCRLASLKAGGIDAPEASIAGDWAINRSDSRFTSAAVSWWNGCTARALRPWMIANAAPRAWPSGSRTSQGLARPSVNRSLDGDPALLDSKKRVA